MADAVKHKSRVHQLYLIGSFLQAKVKNMVFLKRESIYAEYFPEFSRYFGRALILLKYMYGMTKYGKLFADESTEWLIESGFIKYKCQMSIYDQLYLIGSFLQAKVKNRVFLKWESIYAEYFTEFSRYFGRALRLLKYMYVRTDS